MVSEVVAVSGGKDSTAMALRLQEILPGVERIFLYTPTGDELPPMDEHWDRLKDLLDGNLIKPPGPTLQETIEQQQCLPNWRMRWCTRLIKIEPCIDYLASLPDKPVMCVGLRADEDTRVGLYSEQVVSRYPLKEWGWNKNDVIAYLKKRNIKIPERTDCARCHFQRIYEWYELWKNWPDIYLDAMCDEFRFGYTYRSPNRDTWPASLYHLSLEFEKGRIPKKRKSNPDGPCRICRL